jgi:hypothetical protein
MMNFMRFRQTIASEEYNLRGKCFENLPKHYVGNVLDTSSQKCTDRSLIVAQIVNLKMGAFIVRTRHAHSLYRTLQRAFRFFRDL